MSGATLKLLRRRESGFHAVVAETCYEIMEAKMQLNRYRGGDLGMATGIAGMMWLLLGCCLCSAQTNLPKASPNAVLNTNTPEGKIAALKTEMQTAVQWVERIINQPVARVPRRRGMHVSVFKEGWFHPGAHKPDFNNVDVRTTRETPYDQYQYVSSDLNPGVVFVGNQLEFNSNTKYFYKDRSLPKKKLTEAEMLEINRLYRIIGRCEREIAKLEGPPASAIDASAPASADESETGTSDNATPTKRPRLLNPYVGGGLLVLAVLILLVSWGRRSG
jgi:hypothetical protein